MLIAHREPTPSQQRWFGLSLGMMLGIFAGLAYFSWRWNVFAWVLAVSAVTLVAVYYAYRPAQRLVIAGFYWVTWPVQAVVSLVVLCLLYYVVVTPIGIGLRLAGRDPIAKGPDSNLPTYWQKTRTPDDVRRYFRLF